MRVPAHRWIAPVLVGLVGLLGWGSGAQAHAIVVTATPAANATVVGARVPIDLEFNSRIDVTRSRLSLIDTAQHARQLEIEHAAPANRIRAVATDVGPGDQLLEWYVLSTDGHITRGRLQFKVRATP